MPLNLGVPVRTGDLAAMLGVKPAQLYRLADAFGWDKHPGCGRRLWWSEEEQRQLRLVVRMMESGLEPEWSVMVAALIPSTWTHGYAAVWHDSHTVTYLRQLEELDPLDEQVTLIPLGVRGIVNVDTGGRV